MELSLFLARVWGLGITIICLGVFLNRKRFFSTFSKMNSAEVMSVGLLIFGIGIAQVVGYEQWRLDWQGIITLLGWGALLKGVLLFFSPGYSHKLLKLAIIDSFYISSLLLGLALGIYLLYVGYIFY